jgi:hypothetical protein
MPGAEAFCGTFYVGKSCNLTQTHALSADWFSPYAGARPFAFDRPQTLTYFFPIERLPPVLLVRRLQGTGPPRESSWVALSAGAFDSIPGNFLKSSTNTQHPSFPFRPVKIGAQSREVA